MGELVEAAEAKTTNDLAVDRTDMAMVRTIMAADRTLMAWIRTSLSMLSFGFTIYKFLLYVKESLTNVAMKAEGPRRFAIVLIALGTVSMLFGLIDYYGMMKQYGRGAGRSPWSFGFFAGLITFLLGGYLLVGILINRSAF